MPCIICEKNKQQYPLELYRNENVVISHAPLDANILGYFHIEPIEHYENWSEIPIDVLCDVQIALKKLDELLRSEKLAERVYSVTISEMVKHIHFHIIPRPLGSDLKGVELIKKATQQTSLKTDKKLQDHEVNEFIRKAKLSLSK